MPRRNILAEVTLEDSSFCDPDDLWGIGTDTCQLDVEGNPAPVEKGTRKKVVVHRATPQNQVMCAMWSFGLTMSFNEKTAMCISNLIEKTCAPTPWCRKFCYGQGIRLSGDAQLEAYKGNSECFEYMETAKQSEVEQLADAIYEFCKFYEIFNCRWNGVGDLSPGQARVIDVLCRRHPDFVVWGFTRRQEFVIDLPVRDNMCFWASIDSTTSKVQLKKKLEFVNKHRTAMAYSTEYGLPFTVELKPMSRKARSYDSAVVGLDPFLAQLKKQDFPISVIFGLHLSMKGINRKTRVSVAIEPDGTVFPADVLDECPATDPLGGAHFYAACQECRWCIEKPHLRSHHDLLSYRKNKLVTTQDGVLVSLHDGREVA